MPLLLRFRSEDLLQCRFAISPLNETADALRSLTRPGAEAYHLPWQRQARNWSRPGHRAAAGHPGVPGTSRTSSPAPTARSLRSRPN